MTTLEITDSTIILEKPEWQVLSDSIVRAGELSSAEDLLHQALNTWLQSASPELRWKVAIDLYKREEISSGRAAEIAGLNYFVFEEKLRQYNIPFIAAETTTQSEIEQQTALIDELFGFS